MSKDPNRIPSLIDFWRLQRMHRGEQTIVRPCHRIKAKALTDLVLGRLPKPNLMILEPPRIGKTDLGVKAFVAWALSLIPDSEFILSSYGANLANANSIYIRNTLASEWYRNTIRPGKWGAQVLMSGEKAGGLQDYFHTVEGGSVKAVGRGGGITGFGAGKLRPQFGGAIVIDDLLKAQEADSSAARLDAIDYIKSTLKSRRNRLDHPKTPIVLIMQRLHPLDPAGWLLKEEKDDWHVIQIPALDENDQSIWPGRIGVAEMLSMKESDPDTFWAQYMQSPNQAASAIFKDIWWKEWNDRMALEKRITVKFITGDTAFKEKDSADWSVFQCWGAEGTSGLHLIDQIRGKWEFPDLLKYAEAFWAKHAQRLRGITPATEFWIEDKASGISLIQTMRRQAQVPVKPWTPNEMKTSPDKVGRAKQAAQPMSVSRIYLPPETVKQELTWAGLPPKIKQKYKPADFPDLPPTKWVPGFKNEHSSFSADDSHLHDDQVDAETEAVSIWMERGGGTGPLPLADQG